MARNHEAHFEEGDICVVIYPTGEVMPHRASDHCGDLDCDLADRDDDPDLWPPDMTMAEETSVFAAERWFGYERILAAKRCGCWAFSRDAMIVAYLAANGITDPVLIEVAKGRLAPWE